MTLREKAYEILKDVYLKHGYASLSMRALKEDYSEQNQAYLTALVYGTVQNDLFVRNAWQKYAERMPKEEVALLLDMASYEILFMRAKDYAIINECVDIAKKIPHTKADGFVNQVLRKVAEYKDTAIETEDPLDKRSITYSIPKWIISLWIAHYGEEDTLKTLEALKKNSPQYLRVNTLKIFKEELLKRDEKFKNCEDDALIYEGNYLRTNWFKEGYVIAQDLHSQKVSYFAGLKPGMRILDLCAAPGSKTLHMAALCQNQSEIIAVDLYQSRLDLIKEGALKAGAENIKTLQADARNIGEYLKKESFDCVFVDAPCSGLGVLRHKNDIKLHVSPESIDEIVKLQKEILNAAGEMVKRGGRLIYSTCTLNKKENERQIEAYLNEHPDYLMEKMRTYFPYEDEADGFFMVKCVRV